MESFENQNPIANDNFKDNTENPTNEEISQSQPPRAQRRWLPLLATLLVVGGGITIWRLLAPKSEAPSATANQSQATPVKLSEIQPATVVNSSDYIGNLDSRRSVNLLPQIQGNITKIFVKAGDEVPAGTPIIEVDPDEQQAAVNSNLAAAQAAGADLENAKATLRSLEAEKLSSQSQLKLGKQQYERYTRLANEGAIARDTADQYVNSYQAALSDLGVINKRIEAQRATIAQREKAQQQAEANVKAQQAQLGYYTIKAPFAGTVGDIPVKEGDFVNTSTQLTRLTQNRPLEVEISVPIEQGPQLRSGMPVQLLNEQGKSIGTSRIFFIAPSTANTTQSILVKSLFDNAKGQLRADQYVKARVIWNRQSGLLVPATAITRLGGETFVYVAESAPPPKTLQQASSPQPQLVARQKRVKLGRIQGNNYQVLEGLKPGEKIVVSGILNLKDGAAIAPE